MKNTLSLAATILLCAVSPSWTAESSVLNTFDDAATFQQPKEKGTVEQVEGKVGSALKFTFAEGAQGQFAMSRIRGAPEWDQAAGISFWVKGDGSHRLGSMQFVWNEDFSQRYTISFSIAGSEWTKVVVPWSDFIPTMSNADSKPLDPKGDRQPSKLGGMWVGKWWFWRDYAAHSYAIDDLRLETVIEQDAKDYRPQGAPLARVNAKLKAGKPITVVTMGDSLTDYKHNSNAVTNWPTFFSVAIQATFKSTVTVENPAIGGTELRQNLIMLPRWVAVQPKPDLVTICFGFNDYSSGMRGEMFTAVMKDAVQRVRRATKGEADVLIITTLPAVETWDTMAELAAAGRAAAKEQNAGLCDGWAVFHELGKADKDHLYAADKVHLGKPGQEALAKAVVAALVANAKP